MHSDHFGYSNVRKALKMDIPVYMHKSNKLKRKSSGSGGKVKAQAPMQKLTQDERKKINWVESDFTIEGAFNDYHLTLTGKVPHNVDNYGIYLDIQNKLKDNKTEIFFLTDAGNYIQWIDEMWEAIHAMDCDYYFLETNYCKYRLNSIREAIRRKGGYDRYKRSINEHLSKQQTYKFYHENKKAESKLIQLHQSAEVYR